jgi:hypothetical protein
VPSGAGSAAAQTTTIGGVLGTRVGRYGNNVVSLVVKACMRPTHWLTFVMLMLASHGSALGCSCSPASEAPACEKILTADVIFVGTVQSIVPDPHLPAASRLRVYRFQVDTTYRGLLPSVDHIVVNPDNFTSCQTEYRRGSRYLVFASRLAGTDEVISGGCHGSRLAEYATKDLAFLGAYRNNQAGRLVYGRVLQWATSIGRPRREEDAPVAEARVVLSNGIQTFVRQTTQTGDFRFDGVPPGTYSLSAHREPYVANPPVVAVVVPAVGCAERFPTLEARASISGALMNEKGKPAAKERVELLRKSQSGVWYSTYQFWTETNDRGLFKFADLPDGDYVLGYEIWGGRPSNYSPYTTRYYPGVPQLAEASVLHLLPMQVMTDVKLSLGKPDTPRSIRVVVTWPNGTPCGHNLLQLFSGEDLIKNVGPLFGGSAKAPNGIIEFTGYAERMYDLHVRYWIDDLGGPVPHDQQRIARSDRVQLMPGKDAATVKLVLTRKLLSDEDEPW